MLKIDVVAHPTGGRLPFGVQYTTDWGGGPIDPLHPLLLSPIDFTSATFEKKVGNLLYPSPGVHYGSLRDKAVINFQVSGDVVVSARPIQAPIPFRGLVDWGMPFQDVHSCRYDIHGTVLTERLREHSAVLHWRGDFLVAELMFTELYYRIDGVDQYNGTPPPPIVTLMGYVRSGGVIYDYPWAMIDMSSRDYDAVVLDGYFDAMETGSWPFRTRDASVYYVSTTSDSPSVDPLSIVSTIESRLLNFQGSEDLIGSEQDLVDFGELAVECAKQLDYVDSNKLSLVFDVDDWMHAQTFWKQATNLPGWRKSKRTFSRLAKSGKVSSWSDFGSMFKPLASSYLFKKYAVDTAISDLSSLARGFVKFINEPFRQRVHSRRAVVLDPGTSKYYHFDATMTIELGNFPEGPAGQIQLFIQGLKRMGLYPAMTNLYDYLPYSFVVDWFADYGQFVRECDQYLDVENYFPIDYCIMSTKWSRGYDSSSIFPDFSQVSGTIDISIYNRWITRELPLPSVNPVSGGPGPVNHWVESLALILQRVK